MSKVRTRNTPEHGAILKILKERKIVGPETTLADLRAASEDIATFRRRATATRRRPGSLTAGEPGVEMWTYISEWYVYTGSQDEVTALRW
jgi:hypothetical protein